MGGALQVGRGAERKLCPQLLHTRAAGGAGWRHGFQLFLPEEKEPPIFERNDSMREALSGFKGRKVVWNALGDYLLGGLCEKVDILCLYFISRLCIYLITQNYMY